MRADLCRLVIGLLCTQSKAAPLSHIHSLHTSSQCPASPSLSFHHGIHTQSHIMFLCTFLWVGILFWFYSSILSCKIIFIVLKRIRGKDTEGTGWDLLFILYNLMYTESGQSQLLYIMWCDAKQGWEWLRTRFKSSLYCKHFCPRPPPPPPPPMGDRGLGQRLVLLGWPPNY
jgi:hypothetical protein